MRRPGFSETARCELPSGPKSDVGRIRWTRPLALALGGISVAMFVGCCVFALLALIENGESLRGMGEVVVFALFLAFPIVGTLISWKVPRNAIGWICLAAGLLWMSIGFEEMLDRYVLAATGERLTSSVYVALTQGMWVPPVGLLGVYMILLFPDGKLPSRRWRPLAWFAGILMAVLVLAFAFLPGPLIESPGVENPLGIESLAWVVDSFVFVIILLPVCILASAASLVFRFRRANREVRQQIKWLALAAGFLGASYLGSLIVQFFFVPAFSDPDSTIEPAWSLVVDQIVFMTYAGIPIAVGVAVLKYRLYDIEILINRALVYGSLTLLSVSMYLVSVVSLQYVFRSITGSDSQLAIVASTLAIAAMFVPLRRRIQSFIDRRFYRSKYDARKTLNGFALRLRDEVDLSSLDRELLAVVRDTVHPSHASLWIRPSENRKNVQEIPRIPSP